MAIKSLCPSVTLEDPKEDYRTAIRVEQYRVSRQAIYFAAFPGTKYLPFRAVRQAWSQPSSISVTGCCGKQLPVVVMRVKYEGGFYQNITFEKQKAADQVLAMMKDCCPEVILAPERAGGKA
jgi:hypothetical protein